MGTISVNMLAGGSGVAEDVNRDERGRSFCWNSSSGFVVREKLSLLRRSELRKTTVMMGDDPAGMVAVCVSPMEYSTVSPSTVMDAT